MPDIYQQQQNLLAQQQAQARQAIESATPTQMQLRTGNVSSMLQRQATAQNVTALREFLGKAEVAQTQLKEAQTQAQINSPEFQQGAYNEALRILRSGYGRAGLPDNPDAFSQAVKSYYYQIEKGLPRSYAIDKAGNVFTEKTVEVPAPPIQKEIPYGITPQSNVKDLLTQGYTPQQIWTASQMFNIVPGKNVKDLMSQGLTSSQIWDVAKQIKLELQPVEQPKEQKPAGKTTIYSILKTQYEKSGFGPKIISALELDKSPPTFSSLSQTYKGNPLGLVYKGAEQISKGTSFVAQKLGEPKVAAEQLGEQVASTALFTFFVPPIQNRPALNSYQLGKGGYYIEETQPRISTTEITSKSKQKFILQKINQNVPETDRIDKQLIEQARSKATSSRFFETKIGDNTLYTMEYNKGFGEYPSTEITGRRVSFAVELNPKGQPINVYGGTGIFKATDTAENTISKIISQQVPEQNIFQKAFKIMPKTPQAQLDTMLQQGQLVSIKDVKGKTWYFTTEQAKVLESQGINLAKPQTFFKESDLVDVFGGGQPFTKKEWLNAIQLSQSAAMTNVQGINAKLNFQIADNTYNIMSGTMKTKESGFSITNLFARTAPKTAATAVKSIKPFPSEGLFDMALEFERQGYPALSTKYGIGAAKGGMEQLQTSLAQTIPKSAGATTSASLFGSIAAKNMPAAIIETTAPVSVFSTGAYAGKGLYELSQGRGQVPKTIQLQELNPFAIQIEKSISTPITTTEFISKNIQVPQLEQPSLQTPSLEQPSLQIPKLVQPSLQQPVQESSTTQLFKNLSTTTIISPFNIPALSGGLFKGMKEKKRRKTSRAFRVQIKRKGMFRDIGKLLPRGKALKTGAEITKATLAAQFRIVPSKTEIIAEDIQYTPEPRIFRSYQIRKGRKIPMLDTFIQRRGTRLGSRSEVSEIQMFKRARQGRFKLI